MIVTDPALTAFVFLPRRDSAAPVVRKLWDSLETIFGPARPLRSAVPAEWPADPTAGWEDRIVAARDWHAEQGLMQAVASERRDAIGIGVALGRTGDYPVEVFRELIDRLDADLHAAPNLSVCLLGRMASQSVDESRIITAAGLNTWSATPGRRCLVLLTVVEDAARAEEWAWGRPGSPVLRLPLIARYWQSAALLDDQAAVLADTDVAVRERIARVDSVVTAGVAVADGLTGETADTLSATLVDGVEAVIDLSRAGTRLRDVRRTVESLRINLTELTTVLDPVLTGTSHRDTVIAQRWIRQADQTLDHAEWARIRADELVRFGQMRLALAQHRLGDRQQRSVRIQTTLVAALLAGLGAVSTLGVTAHPPVRLRIPVLVAIVAVLAAAPLLAASWHERCFRFVDSAFGGLAAGAVSTAALILPTGLGWAIGGGLLACMATTAGLFLRGRVGSRRR